MPNPIRGAIARRGAQSAAALTKASRTEARRRRRALLGSESREFRTLDSLDRLGSHFGVAISSQSWAEVRKVTATERRSANLNYRAKLTSADARWDSDRGVGKTPFGAFPKTQPARVLPKDRDRVAAKVAATKRVEALRERPAWRHNDPRW